VRYPSVIMGASDETYGSTISHAHITKAANALNTPPVATPPRTSTPPPATEKRKSDKRTLESNMSRGERATGTPTAESIDPNALSKVLLKEFEDAGSGRHRETTPGGSPSRKRQRIYGDR
jgi:cell division cycle 20-like protein 1, cofactor of APC complex